MRNERIEGFRNFRLQIEELEELKVSGFRCQVSGVSEKKQKS